MTDESLRDTWKTVAVVISLIALFFGLLSAGMGAIDGEYGKAFRVGAFFFVLMTVFALAISGAKGAPLVALAIMLSGFAFMVWNADKHNAKHDAECRAIGGEPVRGREFRACLAKGAILKP